MIDYLYDGTFEGILTCIYHHYYTDKAAGVYERGEYQSNLLNECVEVETDYEKAGIVYEAISSKISNYALRNIYRAYLSCDPNKGTKILRYVVLGFKRGYEIGSLRGVQEVYDIETIVKKVDFERERILQFVRFSVMRSGEAMGLPLRKNDSDERDVLYAEVEPEHDVLELVARHFADRFKHDPIIIKDVGRDKAIVAYEGHWYISAFGDVGGGLTVTDEERGYQRLWKTYFEHIAIKERKNSRCQRNFMPVRYWKHLTEMIYYEQG